MNTILNTERTKRIESYFFTFLLYELFLGGSGRVFSFGSITLRMILFSIALLWFSIRIFQNPNKKFIIRMVLFFGITVSAGALVGILNHAPKGLIFTDIKQLLFFLSIISFSFFLNTKEQVNKCIKILKNATLILSLAYLICYSFIKLNILKMEPFYNTLSVEWLHDEFMFRGTGGNFFYKGFFYLGIGIFFYLFSKPTIKNGFIVLIIYVALFLTLLRWLLAITLVIFACTIFFNWAIHKFKISFLKSKQMVFHLVILGVMILIPITFKNFYTTTLGNKQESVDIRKQQFDQVSAQIFNTKKSTKISKINKNQEVVNTTKKFNFILGKGFGIGVPIRPVHMELTYLEIFFKQGILGLSFWFFIFFYCIYNFKRAWYNHVDLNTILPWITGVLVIYFQSITNPLLVNSIGMSFILLALLALRKFSEIETKPKLSH
jgi:hypothetical protein